MPVCGSGDDALGTHGAIHHPSPGATGSKVFSGPGDRRICPSLPPQKIVRKSHLCTRRRSC